MPSVRTLRRPRLEDIGRWLRLAIVHSSRGVLLGLGLPFAMIRAVRRVLTPASTTLVWVGIITLNIIWGYPWTGMFAACASMFILGFVANRVFRPKLKVDVVTPASSQVGQDFSAVAHVQNVGWLPAIDSSLQLTDRRTGSRRMATVPFANSSMSSLPQVMPSDRTKVGFTLTPRFRGVHRLPDVVCESLFPFHLFRSTHRVSIDSTIVIVPRLLRGDEDDQAHQLMAKVGAWTQNMMAGDSSEYTGSREYQLGMTVRRWDFASWARVGKPIVREFNTSSVQAVTVFIDTTELGDTSVKTSRLRRRWFGRSSSSRKIKRQDPQGDESFPTEDPLLERLLSVAATALTQLMARGVRVALVITGEDSGELNETAEVDAERARSESTDLEALLIRLASVNRVSRECGHRELDQFLADHGTSSTLLVSNHPVQENVDVPHSQVVFLRVSEERS